MRATGLGLSDSTWRVHSRFDRTNAATSSAAVFQRRNDRRRERELELGHAAFGLDDARTGTTTQSLQKTRLHTIELRDEPMTATFDRRVARALASKGHSITLVCCPAAALACPQLPTAKKAAL
jgi:hypothetical protein